MAKTYTSVPTVSTLATYPSATYNTYTAQNINNLIVPAAASLTRTAALSHTSTNNYQAISWDGQSFTNTDSMWAASPNPSRILLNTPGLYSVTGSLNFVGNATGLRVIAIYKNGLVLSYGNSVSGNALVNYLNMSLLVVSSGSDYIELMGFQDSTANLAYTPNTMSFSAVWVGRTS